MPETSESLACTIARALRRNRFRAVAFFAVFCPITKARRLGPCAAFVGVCMYKTTGPDTKRLPENKEGENAFLVSRCCLGSIRKRSRCAGQVRQQKNTAGIFIPQGVAAPSGAYGAKHPFRQGFARVLKSRARAFFSSGGAGR